MKFPAVLVLIGLGASAAWTEYDTDSLQAGTVGQSERYPSENPLPGGDTQSTLVDSFQVEEAVKDTFYLGHCIRGLGGSKHPAVRIPVKVEFAIPFYVAFTAISTSLYDTYFYDDADRIENDPNGGLEGVFLVWRSAVGSDSR